MSNPRIFQDFGKITKDLFEPKDFDLKQPSVTIKANVKEPKSEINIKLDAEKTISGEVSDKIFTDYGTVKCTLHSKKNPSLELVNKSWVDGLQLKANLDSLKTTKLAADYSREHAALSAKFEYSGNNEILFKPSAVLSYDNFSFGVEANINPLADKDYIPDYNVGFEYSKKNLNMAMKTKDCAQTLCGSMSYRLNEKTLLGIGYTGGFQTKEFMQNMLVGGSYRFDDNLHMKGKLSDCGRANILLTHRICSQAAVAFSSQFYVRDQYSKTESNGDSAPKFGVKLILDY